MQNIQLFDMKRVQFRQDLTNFESITFADRIFFVDNGDVFYIDDHDKCVNVAPLYVCSTHLTHLTGMQKVWFGTGEEFVFIDQNTFKITSVAADMPFITASWSPNQNLIAVCESDGRVRCYRINFANATVTAEENFNSINNEPLAKDISNLQPKIVWNNHSKYFCVCYYDQIYKINMFDITGKMKIILDDPCLLPLVTWRHNLIVCVCQTECKQYEINMYERNGHFHSSLILDDTVREVSQIAWDEIGDVLLIHFTIKSDSFLNIYTFVNYTHQLKQQLLFTKADPLLGFQLVDNSKYVIHLMTVTADATILRKFIPQVQCGMLPNGNMFHVDINNNILKLQRIIGDPLSGTHEPLGTVTNKYAINAVAFSTMSEKFITLDSYSNVIAYHFRNNKIYKFSEANTGSKERIQIYNPCFTTGNVVMFSCLTDSGSRDLYGLNFFANTILPLRANENIIHMKFITEKRTLLKINASLDIYLDDTNCGNRLGFEPRMSDYFIVDQKLYIVILDVFGQIWINEHLVCASATSFLIHKGFLYVTASVNRLYCVRLNETNVETLCRTHSMTDFFWRMCESNSELLFGVSNKNNVILRHIRGNTETVTCRNVAIDQVGELISRNLWSDAFEFVRLERLDPNVLIDISPKIFLEDVSAFIEQVDSPKLIESLLINLVDENTLTTTYKDAQYPVIKIIENKKKVINEAILNIMKKDLTKYIRPVMIAAYTVNGLTAAMDFLFVVYEKYGDVGNVISHGLSTLRLYINDEEIRRAALCRTHLNFAQCVFEKFNIDPKIYEQLFKDIEKYKSNVYRQCFVCQNYMENYTEALQCLILSCMYQKLNSSDYDDRKDIDEIIEHAQTNNLVTNLYKLCVQYKFFNKTIISVYAEGLTCAGRFEEAGFIYINNQMWEEALECFVECRRWKQSLHVMDCMGLNDTDRVKHLTTLATALRRHCEYKDAAHLYRKYLSMPEAAIDCCVSGQFYEKAIQYCYSCNKLDLIETKIKPRYTAHCLEILERIEQAAKLFEQHSKRLRVVRDKDAKIAEDTFIMHDEHGTYAESVAGSIRTTTVRTRSSAITSRSKKMEKKKQDLREGGPYENIALMRALHNQIETTYKLCLEVEKLCNLLLTYDNEIEKAERLQRALSTLLNAIKSEIPYIWPTNLNVFDLVSPEMIVLRKNLSDLDVVYRYPPKPPTENWKIPMLDDLF